MKKEDVAQQECFSPPNADAALQFFRALQQLVETSAKNCMQDLPEQILHMSHRTHQIETNQQKFLNHFESVRQYLEKLAATGKLLENAGKVNDTLSIQHYQECIIEPMVRSLFVVNDLIEDVQRSSEATEVQNEILNAVKTQLLQFLANYGIEIVCHDQGSPFDPQFMKPLSKVSTQDRKLEGCIAQSLQSGFMWNKQRLLRPESVSLYKFENVNINLIEEGGVI
jgi:molecular chaperone GrpE (heat shock protein)